MEKVKATKKQMVKVEKLMNEIAALVSANAVFNEVAFMSSDIEEAKAPIEVMLNEKSDELVKMFEVSE